MVVCSFFAYKAYWQTPLGVQAQVQSLHGSAYGISDAGDRLLSVGEPLKAGEQLRTSGGAHAVLRLLDGSLVEVNERSVLGVDARGHNMTVTLDDGTVIVQAAKRDAGHLYLKTPDCRVAVTGTVFSVNSSIKGSRVAVLQGAVQVVHAGMDSVVQAGDQMTTSDNLSPAPIEQQISWSQDRDKYLLLLAQFATMQHRLEQIPFPQPRYTSDLLARVPANNLLYISIPNLGDFVSEAHQIFEDQLQQSPVLARWWDRTHAGNPADLNALFEKLHQASQYLGDEIVIVGTQQAATPGLAIVADLRESGLDDFLRKQVASSTGLILLEREVIAGGTCFSKTTIRRLRADAAARGSLLQQHRHVERDRRAIECWCRRLRGRRFWKADLSGLWARRRNHPGSGSSSNDGRQAQPAARGWEEF